MSFPWPLTLEAVVAIALGAAVAVVILVEFVFHLSQKRAMLESAGRKMKAMCLRDIKDSVPHIIKPDLIKFRVERLFFGVPRVKLFFDIETVEDRKLIENIVDGCVEECLAEPQWHNITTCKMYLRPKRSEEISNGK